MISSKNIGICFFPAHQKGYWSRDTESRRDRAKLKRWYKGQSGDIQCCFLIMIERLNLIGEDREGLGVSA